MSTGDWTTAEELVAQLRRLWDRGRLLQGPEDGGVTFPLALRLRRPSSADMAARFEDVRRWIRDLDAASRAHVGHGYDVRWTEIDHRTLGRNRVPEGASVPTRDDALRLLGKQRAARRFDELVALTEASVPALTSWMRRKPLVVVEHERDWPRLLDVVLWFRAHPRCGLYLRQLDIPGVDTKFIEGRLGLLTELLDLALPEGALAPAEKRLFEARFGLQAKPRLVRFRILDPRHALAGLTDLTVPIAQFASLCPAWQHVFVTENEINGLAFPAVPDAAVVFGLGYGIDRLREAPWLGDRALHYWGDIDTHGFAMLDRLRAHFPHAASLLMDRATLLANRELWVREDAPHAGPLTRLTAEEHALFEELGRNTLGDGVRLEQERIRFGSVEQAVREVTTRTKA